MATPPAVLVVGSFVQDLTFSCAQFPLPGQTTVGTFVTGPGGKGSNQAVACARAGASTCFVGAVGADAFGEGARTFYQAEGIATRWALKPKLPTGTAGILVNAEAQNEIIVALGANAALQKRDVPASLLASAQVVVTQLESNLDTVAHTLKTAWENQVLTVLNPAPMRPEFDLSLLRHVDVLIPNETEFAQLAVRAGLVTASELPAEQVATLPPATLHALCQRLGPPTVIVTLGRHGCLFSHPEGFKVIKAHRGIKVVDSTGAGDAFVGGFAAGLIHFEGDLHRAARFGNTVAALSVTKPGTAPSMPTRQEITRFLRTQKSLP